MPIRRRSGGTIRSGVLSVSESTRTAPACGRSSPAITRSSVVLPQPLGPSSAVTLPRANLERNILEHGRLVIGKGQALDHEAPPAHARGVASASAWRGAPDKAKGAQVRAHLPD